MSAKLPKPVSSATDEQLQAYIDGHLEGGDKRVLAEEVMRLRKMLSGVGLPEKGLVFPPPAPQPKEQEEDPLL